MPQNIEMTLQVYNPAQAEGLQAVYFMGNKIGLHEATREISSPSPSRHPACAARADSRVTQGHNTMIGASKPPPRQLIWGGLAARCSACGWTTIYQPGQVAHGFPDAERSHVIHTDYERHRCEDFPAPTHGKGPLHD